MKQILVILAILLLLFFAFQCGEKKKPNNPDLEDPSYYFPINRDYKWTYVRLGFQCVVSEEDSFVITAKTSNTRVVEGVGHTGWDLVLTVGGEGTGFVYRVADTIFYWKDVSSTLPPYKVLVGPIRAGSYWRDRSVYGHEYNIVEFEDLYSAAAGKTYPVCAKIKRITPGSSKTKYYWWAPQTGKVKEAEYESGECRRGEELKRLDKSPLFP